MVNTVLYLSYDGLTDPLGQSQILPYAIGLSGKGYELHIISFEKCGSFEKEHDIVRRLIAVYPITWHPLTYHKKPPILSTLYDLYRMWRLATRLVSSQGIGLVHCRSYLAGMIGLRLKQRHDVKFLFDIRGFWADERMDGGLWSLDHIVYRKIYQYFKREEIRMMQGADHIISLTHAGKMEIVSGNLFQNRAPGISAEKITVIPCAVDLELFDPTKIKEQDRIALKRELGLEAVEHVLVYLGSIGTWYMLDEMLDYFKTYEKTHSGSYFLFVTKDDPVQIYRKAGQIGIASARIIVRSAGRQQVPLYLSIATLGIFFIKPCYSKKASSATKMGEMLAMGLDIICNEIGDIDGEVDHLVSNYQIGNLEIVRVKSEDQKIINYADYRLDAAINKYSTVYHQRMSLK